MMRLFRIQTELSSKRLGNQTIQINYFYNLFLISSKKKKQTNKLRTIKLSQNPILTVIMCRLVQKKAIIRCQLRDDLCSTMQLVAMN